MPDLDALFGKLRRLTPDKLARVEALVDRFDEVAQRGRFKALAGVLSAEEATLMARAIEDCERIDPRGW